MRVDGSVSNVNEETKLAKTAAVADKFVDVGVCMRISSTLESEICKMSALSLFNSLRDYATTFDFLKRAKAIGLPMSELITHKFPLEEINEALETNLAMTGLKIAIVNK